MQTKAMRSASSEDIRSEARREIRTREGKDRQLDSSFWVGAEISGPWESGAGGYASSGAFKAARQRTRYSAVTSTTSNSSVRDSLPDQIENSLPVSSQNR